MKRILTIALAAVMALTLMACGAKQTPDASAPADSGAQSATSAESTELKDITFVLDWTPNTNHTGLYVAIENGYFEEAGLNVSVVQPPEDGAEMLVGSGKAQFGVSFQDTLAPVFVGDSPLPVTAVAALVQHNTSGILSRKGEGMDHPAGLEGKKYATWDMPVEKAMMENVVETDGGDFSKVELIPSTVTDEVSALKSQSVDAIWVFYGWGGVATDVAGLENDYFAFADVNPIFDYYSPVVIANNEFLETNPETAKAFLAAMEKGFEYSIENPDDAAEILIAAAPELGDSRDLVVASQEYLSAQYKADVEQWGVFDADRWNAFYNWLGENELVEAVIPENTGFTNDYLPA